MIVVCSVTAPAVFRRNVILLIKYGASLFRGVLILNMGEVAFVSVEGSDHLTRLPVVITQKS
jgi:hypothetical protein